MTIRKPGIRKLRDRSLDPQNPWEKPGMADYLQEGCWLQPGSGVVDKLSQGSTAESQRTQTSSHLSTCTHRHVHTPSTCTHAHAHTVIKEEKRPLPKSFDACCARSCILRCGVSVLSTALLCQSRVACARKVLGAFPFDKVAGELQQEYILESKTARRFKRW